MASNKDYGKEAVRIKELEAKAEQGDENAHYHLGLHYFNTRDIWTPKSYQKNIEQALNHFKKANGKYNSKYYIKLIEKG